MRYNVYAPLKAFFRPNETDPPVTTQGYVSESNCGAFPPILGYVPWEVDPWFTSIGECICPIMHHFKIEYYFVFIHLFVYLCLSEYFYIHDDLGLFWITGKKNVFLFFNTLWWDVALYTQILPRFWIAAFKNKTSNVTFSSLFSSNESSASLPHFCFAHDFPPVLDVINQPFEILFPFFP